jgi:hypothetical protein
VNARPGGEIVFLTQMSAQRRSSSRAPQMAPAGCACG